MDVQIHHRLQLVVRLSMKDIEPVRPEKESNRAEMMDLLKNLLIIDHQIHPLHSLPPSVVSAVQYPPQPATTSIVGNHLPNAVVGAHHCPLTNPVYQWSHRAVVFRGFVLRHWNTLVTIPLTPSEVCFCQTLASA
ncbi:hypothetical protein L1887_07656 [Cichorium endivia]|nr:hypothetical protein L1887_07656 [Cichorium endivia]